MLIKKKKGWHIPESEAAPEEAYMSRRQFFKTAGSYGLGAGLLLSGAGGLLDVFGGSPKKEDIVKVPQTPLSRLYPAKRNERFALDRPLTDEVVAARYNNFYEFSSRKNVWEHVEKFKPRPWSVEVAGLVEKPFVMDVDSLIKRMPLEERLYRLRCVEAWAMAVPWTGFPMMDFIKFCKPLSGARYIRMRSFLNTGWALNQRLLFWHTWPYEEGLTMEEAANELTLLVTGIYGHELPKQHGSPIRLIVPWKYGFKSIKSITRFEFTDERPSTFWNTAVPDEYDFQANVNPLVPHPRWSQATERMIGTDEVRKTVKYNGYGEFAAKLYEK